MTRIAVRPCASHEELAHALDAISHYFGVQNTIEDAERFAKWMDVERMHAAWKNGRVVGGAGAFAYDLSVPGGATVKSAGVTVIGVLPTHRRGILTEPDLLLDVGDLGSVYLGGFTWRDLRAALRVQEHAAGAVDRADRVFGSWPKPWCPEIF